MLLVLSLILALRQRFTKQMGEVKQFNIKTRTYYFYNDIINLKDFDARLLKVDRKSYKNIDVYYVGYITIKKNDNYESIYSVNPLYLRINHVSGYIIKKKKKKKNTHLFFNSFD